ncbi:MAG: phosphatase domain-containing protein [Bacteroidota bacterium]
MSALLHRSWDKLVRRLGWGQDKPVTVANYLGFARPDYLYLSGRVLREKAISRSEQDGMLQNFLKNFNRFNSRELPGAELEIEWGGQSFELITDAEGYFKLERTFDRAICTSAGLNKAGISSSQVEEPGEMATPAEVQRNSPIPNLWQQARVTVLNIPGQPKVNYVSYSDVIMPALEQAEFGIISDIDDTVLQTDVTSLLKLRAMLHTILKNAGSRTAFEQVAEFYQALQLGPDGQGHNPCFYVSNSPWNLYDLLQDFLETNDLPRGPILLRDFGLPYEKREADYRGHKTEMVHRILQTYPQLPFILIGDSGEHDFNIYLEAAKAYPGQVRQIYIRDVQHERRARHIQQLMDEEVKIPARLVASYAEAMEHARIAGFVAAV